MVSGPECVRDRGELFSDVAGPREESVSASSHSAVSLSSELL